MRKDQYERLARLCNGVVYEVDQWVTEEVRETTGQWYELSDEVRNNIAGLIATLVGEVLVSHGPKLRAHHDNMIEAMNDVAGGAS